MDESSGIFRQKYGIDGGEKLGDTENYALEMFILKEAIQLIETNVADQKKRKKQVDKAQVPSTFVLKQSTLKCIT